MEAVNSIAKTPAPQNAQTQAPAQMKGERPKIGVVDTPPKTGGTISKDTLAITKAKAPADIKNAGAKKRKSPINIVNYLYAGVASICTGAALYEILKLVKKK